MPSDFEDRLEEKQGEVAQPKDILQTEEATKNARVMPFIKGIVDYDVFNPLEVLPEFAADQRIRKSEKIDHVIKQNGAI